MAYVNPYLNFAGNTEAAFLFYKSVFGGEFAMLQRFSETPEADKIPAQEQDKIMHIALRISPNTVLMATDALESMGHKVNFGNHISLAITAESKDEADRLFAGLSAGGQVEMPMTVMFWGAYFGMLTDPFGVKWMVDCEMPKNLD
jgi:PhnB protein